MFVMKVDSSSAKYVGLTLLLNSQLYLTVDSPFREMSKPAKIRSFSKGFCTGWIPRKLNIVIDMNSAYNSHDLPCDKVWITFNQGKNTSLEAIIFL